MELANQAAEVLFFSERLSLFRSVAAVIGTAWLLKVVLGELLALLNTFRAYFLAPWDIFRMNFRKYGSWASELITPVVTGASEGIGRGYAIELARQGLNVAILSRSEAKLNAVAATIRQYNREVRVIPVDFTEGQSVYADIQAEISDLDVAVLVNNVGLGLEYPDYLLNVPEDRHRNIVELNCQTMVQMTHLVLPKMVEKGGGVIINLSSACSVRPTPFFTVPGAAKIFAAYFSCALQYEYAEKGIIVQCVRPFYVATASTKMIIRRPKWWAPSPDYYARCALATVGIESDTFGCLSHAFQGWVTSLLSTFSWFEGKMMLSMMKKMRHQAINSMQKKQ